MEELEFLTIDDFDLKDKTVFCRIDINCPIDAISKKITDDKRIKTHSKTIADLKETKLVLMAHQGRPGDPEFVSLEEHAERLGKILENEVEYVDEVMGECSRESIKRLEKGDVLLLENLRFCAEEVLNKPPEEQTKTHLVQRLFPLADYYINDAFASAHRSQPSLVGFPVLLPSCAGRVMETELRTLSKVTKGKERPAIFLLGGIKVDDSTRLVENLLKSGIVDQVLTLGLVGNFFNHVKGHELGDPCIKLIQEKTSIELVNHAMRLLLRYGDKIKVPSDFAISKNGERVEVTLEECPSSYPIYDIGSNTVEEYSEIIKDAKIIVWDGPAGVFEDKKFEIGTKRLLEAVSKSNGFSLVGGGHLIAATEKMGFTDKVDYISTGGKSLISFLIGEKLPAIETLKESAKKFRGVI